MKLIDVHCHLDQPEFRHDLKHVIERARKNGVIAIINSALGPNQVARAIKIAQAYKGYIFLSIGLEPYKLERNIVNETMELIRKFRRNLVALGEVGLDYYWVKGDAREIQEEIFISFIYLAQELRLPLVIHSRSAGKYAIEILIENGASQVLMHAFDGAAKYARKGVSAGFYFTIPTSVVRSKQKQKLAREVPLENLMLETDSPVLSPIAGERNEPSNLGIAALKVAEIKGLNPEEIAEQTTINAIKFFNLPIELS